MAPHSSPSRLWALAHEVAERLVVAPIRDYIDQAVERLEIKMTSGQASVEAAFTRFADVQNQGFAAVRAQLSELVTKAEQSGDTALQAVAARLDAGVDSLAAGFAQLTTATNADPNLPTVDNQTPGVNPDTPAPTDTVPDVTDTLPLDPVDVQQDPDVATPADPGSPQPDGSDVV